MSVSSETKQRIDGIIASDNVVLFMKGTRNFPQCGFSATVIQILNGLVDEFTTVNVLSDPEIRQGIKDYSEWPTIPQLYIAGEFVGGCDIIKDLNASGDLHKSLGVSYGDVEPPKITVTPSAAEQLQTALTEADQGDFVHIGVTNRFEHSMEMAPKGKFDLVVEAGGLTLLIDPVSAKRAEGLTIDFVDRGLAGAGFKLDNPNAPAEVKALSPKELKTKIDAGEVKEIFDVRTEKERDTAAFEGSRLFDDEASAYIEGLAKDTPIAFLCHRGQRSMQAAHHFRDLGFTELYNLSGGIDAWSVEVDDSIPRY